MVASCALASCNALPRDPDGTFDRIRHDRTVRIGLLDLPEGRRAEASALIKEVERRAGARAVRRTMATEPALAALQEERLDLVLGTFAKDSPWKTDVAFAPPLARWGGEKHPIALRAAMRNGENRWIMLVEEASRTVAPQ